MSFTLLGILNAQASGGAAGATSFDLLETTILTADTASVEFTGLGAYTDYKHLQIRAVAQTNRAASSDDITVTVNSITNSYALHTLIGTGSSVISGEDSPNKAAMRIFQGATGNSTANAYGAFVCDVLDFASSTKNTTIRAFSGSGSVSVALSSGLTNNTAAVTSLNFGVLTGTNFVTGSRFSLYGIKAA